MDRTTLVKDRLIKRYMGILSKKTTKHIEPQAFFDNEKKRLVDDMISNRQYTECLSFLDSLISQIGDGAYNSTDGFELIKKTIEVSYLANKKEEAYRFIALLSFSSRAQSNMSDFLFTVSELSFNARDSEFAKGCIKALYQFSDGAFFCYEERKKYLRFSGIVDTRTFDDYSEDY